MAEIECELDYVTLENDRGNEVDGVRVTCPECGHETESYGTGAASVRRCLALLREECPEGKKNFYITGEGAEDG